MRLEKINSKIIVWETGSKNNKVEYDNSEDISKYGRRKLSYVELFLRKNNEDNEADIIKAYLGKIIRCASVPQLIPTGTYKVNSMLSYLKDSIAKYVEEYGLNLNPDFQRAHVWNQSQRVAYIEFILQDGKSNPIYFNCINWMKFRDLGEFVIVDGKQRLTSILRFLDNEFPIFQNLDSEGIGYYAREFNHIPYNVEIIINDLKTRKQVLQWYLQMNKGNVAHTEEELTKVENLLKEED